MTVLVTGGAGFIGSHVARELVGKGYEVIILDDLSTGRLDDVPKSANLLIIGSITDPLTLRSLRNKNIDFVYHYAAFSSVPGSIKDPIKTNSVNITGTLNVLNFSREIGAKKFLLATSGQVYGDGLARVETMSPRPLCPYTLSKLTGEEYCRLFSELYNLKTVCLRYANVYGDGMNPKSEYALAVPAFIDRMSNGLSPIIYGDGEQTRDFIFIDDIVDASIYAVESNMAGLFNVGTGIATSINKLVDVIYQSTQEPIYKDGRLGEARDNSLCIDKLKSAGFTPKWGLKEGLDELVKREGKLLYASKLS